MLTRLFAAAALAALPVSASAAQLILAPSNVIGSSGFYAGFDFGPGEILDQQTGTVTESFGTGYWLNPDNGPAAAYITIDLGAARSLASLTLFNSHNDNFADRGTGNFTITASNSVVDSGGGNFVLTGAITTVVSGTLNADPALSNPTAQSFGATGYFRYISFNPTSVATVNTSCCGANNYGLNELRVSLVPEPATWALLIAGFAMTGVALRRREAARAA